LNDRFGWRAALWFLVFIGVLQFLLIVFFLPETTRRSKREGTDAMVNEMTSWGIFAAYAVEPITLLRLLRYPPVILAVTYTSIACAALVLRLFCAADCSTH
jgi:predicted MFS family arabinose efflux permease